jgi:flavin-dependent dehydrogenase
MEDHGAGLKTKTYDVAVVGGALSGAATALLLKREDPTLSILLVEKSVLLKRRVGEATVEVSGHFLSRVLGLTSFLTQTQLCKNGLRFWFNNDQTGDRGDCSEIGGKYLSTVPSFLVDRAVLDEEVLRRAIEEGVEVLRPATVTSVDLITGGIQRLHLNAQDGARVIEARWVVDASGVRCLLARANNWWHPNPEHPTLAVWSRWRGVGDWDDHRMISRHPQMADAYVGIRGTATNHMTGDGWWSWWINLKGDETSVGVVIDTRHVEWPNDDAPVGEKLRRFLSRHVAAREMLKGAEFVEGDVHLRRNLPYFSEVQSGDGFVLTGDAWAFLDPFYSPGMDWIAFTSLAAVRLIMAWRRGEEITLILETQNRDFSTGYRRMFEALYKDKYDYLGDYEFMQIALRLDIGLYYFFVVRPVFSQGVEGYEQLPYASGRAYPIFALMRLYNSRLAAMARRRRVVGSFGVSNNGRRYYFSGFNFRVSQLLKIIFAALGSWILLELREGWKSWGAQYPRGEEAEEGSSASKVPQPGI